MRPSASTAKFSISAAVKDMRMEITLRCMYESVTQSLDIEGFDLALESLLEP